MIHMRSGVGAHVPTAALLAAAAMLLALPAAGGTSNRFDLPWECIEASSVLLHASLDSNDSSPAAWPWIGRMPYNPVLLERLRQTAHLDGTTRRCLSMVDVESMSGRWPLCVDAGRPPVVHLYSLGRSPDGVFWRKEVCYAPGAGDAVHGLSAPMAALVLAFGAETMLALTRSFERPSNRNGSAFSIPWPSISQMLVSLDVCTQVADSGTDFRHARHLADLQAILDEERMQVFVSTRQRRSLRTGVLAPGLLAAGFPEEVCRYRLSLMRQGGGVSETEAAGEGEIVDGSTREWHPAHESVRVLGQVNSCSSEAAFFLDMAPAGERRDTRRDSLAFPGRDAVVRADSGGLLLGLDRCAAACVAMVPASVEAGSDAEHGACRSWSYWGREDLCVGCREGHWHPIAADATAGTGVVVSRMGRAVGGAIQGARGREEPFFLAAEPKGGWTMTDVVGFPFSSDADMVHYRWRAAMADWGGGREACRARPRAAVVYLVGPREEDMAALEESVQAVERLLLLPHGNCYPLFFFRESWEGGAGAGAQARVRAAAAAERTRVQMEFLVADMSFPAGFDASRYASLHSKRSAWGYQHMSRFWVRTVFEHPRVAALDFYLRLDSDSLLLSPVLDLFQDAALRGIKYGYRMAGKDWRGRHQGLWRFHRDFVVQAACAEVEEGDLALAPKLVDPAAQLNA